MSRIPSKKRLQEEPLLSGILQFMKHLKSRRLNFNLSGVQGIDSHNHRAFSITAAVNCHMRNIGAEFADDTGGTRHHTRFIIGFDGDTGTGFTEAENVDKGIQNIALGDDANQLFAVHNGQKADVVIPHHGCRFFQKGVR